MARTERYGGENWYGQWIHAGGTVTLSGDQTVFTWTRGAQMRDTTAGSDDAVNEAYVRADESFSITMRALSSAAGTLALVSGFDQGQEGTLIFSTGYGTASGQPKMTAVAIVRDASVPEDHANTTDWTINWGGQTKAAITAW